jgi:hypothetical protein
MNLVPPRALRGSAPPSSLLVALLLAAAVFGGCGTSVHGVLTPDQRPILTITSGPIERAPTSYDVRLDWFATDPDGYVTKVEYAADPPVVGDTAWVTATRSSAQFTFRTDTPDSLLPPLGSPIIARSYHTVVLRAFDNAGLACAPVSRSFTATSIAPSTTILWPTPTHEIPISTPLSFLLQWKGVDPDGTGGRGPVRYAYRLVTAADINPDNPISVSPTQVQSYFGQDATTGFATWTFVGGDTSSLQIADVTPGVTYYFAIVAFDETGAFEPRFNLDSNVLQFRPTPTVFGPVITVFNQYFAKTQQAGGVFPTPQRTYPVSIPAGQATTFNWTATPGVHGTYITGYRWAVDLPDSDVYDSTARTGPNDETHWSDWSILFTYTTVGPYSPGPGDPTHHRLYIEARDFYGTVSLLTLDLQVVSLAPSRPLLVIDDMYGALLSRNRSANPQIVLPQVRYPVEAEQDSFYYAVGGFPDSLRILSGTPGAVSLPGAFAGFDYDTLDYAFWPTEGVGLAELARYQVVAAYTDQTSSAYHDPKFGGAQPMTALRYMNTIGHENWLALYAGMGGKLWLFGDGTTTAISNGYYSRINPTAVPRLPLTSGVDPRANLLMPGDFLYDFCHLRSELSLPDPAFSQFTIEGALKACLPYLPQYALAPGEAVPADRSKDPRVGPSAARTAVRWSGLPRLTLGGYRTLNTDPTQRLERQTWEITKPLSVTEGSGAATQSVMDTLYLYQASVYDPNGVQVPDADGFPNAVDYHGSEHGEVVWFGFPLYDFELDQARQLTSLVLTNLGVPRAPGAGGAHPLAHR